MIKIIISRALLFAFVLVGAWLAGALGKELYNRYQLQQEIDNVRLEISGLEKENGNLAAMIQSFQRDETIELEARKRLNIKKPGEEVVIVVPGKEDELIAQEEDVPMVSSAPSAQDDQPESLQDGFGRRAGEWWKFVFQ